MYHCILHFKLFIFCIESKIEFMVRWGNSLSMTFRYSNGIRQGGQLSPLLYNVYTDDLKHHLQATGVGSKNLLSGDAQVAINVSGI